MSGIFICYRREDTQPTAGRLYDRLVGKFSKEAVFMDIDSLAPGVDFVKKLEEAVEQCDVMLVLVGSKWLSIKAEDGTRRIDGDRDYVRLEIASGLDREITVVPILIQNTPMPRAMELPREIRSFARHQALEIVHNRFHQGAQEVIDFIEQALPTSDTDDFPEFSVKRTRNRAKSGKQAQEDDELDGLWTDALAEFHIQNWDGAVELLAEIVERRADYESAATKLQIAQRQLWLDTLFEEAKTAFDAGSWPTAIKLLSKISAKDADYEDAQTLLAEAQRQKNLAVLYAEGAKLHRAKKWAAVVKVFEKIHRLDGDYPDPDDLLQTAKAQIDAKQQSRKAAKLYREAIRHMDKDELKEAEKKLLDVVKLLPDYKETQALISRIQEFLGTLSLGLSANPRRQYEGRPVTWTVSLRNKGHNPISEVTIKHGRKVLAEAFELPAGKGRRFRFEKTYGSTGQKTAKVNVSFVLSSGATQQESKTGIVDVVQPPRKAAKESPRFSSFAKEPPFGTPYFTSPSFATLKLSRLDAPVLENPTETAFGRTWKWTAVPSATGYVLETSSDAKFKNPIKLYSGTDNSFLEITGTYNSRSLLGITPKKTADTPAKHPLLLPLDVLPVKPPAYWYYRVKAENTASVLSLDSAWSNVVIEAFKGKY